MECLSRWISAALLGAALLSAEGALAQCLLANPSFEMPGQGGQIFAGWQQFGSFGASSNATHGQVAARVTSPNAGPWQVSGLYQSLDTAPGERWVASVAVRNSSTRPLGGQSRAIVNIEWRDGAGQLIQYESHTAADASTPVDQPQLFSVESQPAPTGVAKARLLLGVLQGPGDPTADVFYDQATFVSLKSPTVDDLQWSDFAGGRTVSFGGRTWRVKGPGYYGPGPDLYCNSPSCVWADSSGQLHMTIRKIGGSWYSTEAVLEEPLGYGDYRFTIPGPLDPWHPNVVLGLFLWEYGRCYDPADGWWNPYNEIDVEISRWSDPSNQPAQFVAQPYDYPGNLVRFDASAGSPETFTHAFRWLPNRVEFRTWRGGSDDESAQTLVRSWTYTGPHVPRPDQPRVHINLWQFTGPPGADQEAVIESFRFEPACVGPLCGPLAVGMSSAPVARLAAVLPNPFYTRATIRCTVRRESRVEIAVFDVTGRRLRTLEQRVLPAGDHDATWDGRDAAGRRVGPGVYLYRVRAGDRVESGHMVLLD